MESIGLPQRTRELSRLTPRWQPSPNFGERRDGALPDLVVLHYTAMPSAEAAVRTLCNPETEVSAHYLIAPSGQVTQMVRDEHRAWHAGAGQWGGLTDVNSRSIGIELANCGFSPFAARQIDALESLLGELMSRWAIRPERIIGHSDMAPGRKIDPGRRFDWRRLARQRLSVWPESGPEAETPPFREALARFGYTADVDEAALLGAFRLRFRPAAVGPLDATDRRLAANLAKRFPVDQVMLTS